MLRPNKHSDPSLTVLPIAGRILAILRTRRIASVSMLRDQICRDRTEAEPLLVPAFHTLYLLGLIAYRGKVDAFEYVGP